MKSGAARIVFQGAEGNRLLGEVIGEGAATALLLHGGGQTRHAWKRTAERLAADGLRAIALDQRGHGDSQWVDSGRYEFGDFAADAAAVCRSVADRFGARPVGVGASLGGLALLLAEARSPDLLTALVLVDIVPQMEPAGVEKIEAFMKAHMAGGFATLEDAADAIAAYLPHRERPKSLGGLAKNLRLDPDGRYRWHWDPQFMDGPHAVGRDRVAAHREMSAAASTLKLPVLLVRGKLSDLVTEERVARFREAVPHLETIDVGNAAHMVAGDQNDIFTEAILGFVESGGSA